MKKLFMLLGSIFLAAALIGAAYFLSQGKDVSVEDEATEIEREPSYYEKDIDFRDDKVYILKLGKELKVFIKNKGLENFIGYTLSRQSSGRDDSALNSNYDVIRLTNAAAYKTDTDNRFKKLFNITNDKEWEFALKEVGTNDFIGGSTHGDEILSDYNIEMDSEKIDTDENIMYEESDELIISATSDLYRDSSTTVDLQKVATRDVIYTFNADGLNVSQRIDFVESMNIERSYLAMLPILRNSNGKQITDTVFSEDDVINNEFNQTQIETSEATITGKENTLSATVSIEEKTLDASTKFFVSNSEVYNKLYFMYSEDGYAVEAGEVWEQSTNYDIKINK